MALSPSDLLADEALPGVVAQLVEQQLRRDRECPMRPHKTAQQLARLLPIELDGQPRSWADTQGLLQQIMEVIPSTSSRRFFNQLFGGRDPVAIAGEVAAVLTNSPMHTFKASGVGVLLERAVLRRMGALAGMPEGDGMIAPGGSLSNFVAILMARERALPGAREHGLPGGRTTLYTSAESHYSVRKAAAMAGLGRQSLRLVPVDAGGRMQPEALARMIADDRAAGAVPVMINATAGTTVRGAFDPLPAVADVAQHADVWLHVDAAYGGSVLLSKRHRYRLEGCERADSLTWDAHKLLNVPLTCSALLTRSPGRCAAMFDEPASYLFQDDALFDPGRGSLQCARRNDALKLWLLWTHLGDEGLERRIDRLFDGARHVTERVRAHSELRLCIPTASINVCFEVPGVSSRRLCRALWERQVAKIGHAIVDGREVVRWVFVNPQVDDAELDAVLDELVAVARTLRDEAEPGA